LRQTFVDLGKTPLANSYVAPDRLDQPDKYYPLHARVCDNCFLVQVDDVVPAHDIFSDYAYFSSYSDTWIAHARAYAMMMRHRFGLTPSSKVVEVASNDGYLLQHFMAMGISVLGVEPAANVAAVARSRGVPTEVAFFGAETARRLARSGHASDVMVSNNVLAHVPDINDFVWGVAILLKPSGIWTVEFPHLLNLIEQVQFDTIYHEHYSYLSLLSVERILTKHGLAAFDVEEIFTHGGSLRVFVGHADGPHKPTRGLELVRVKEKSAGLDRLSTYEGFTPRVEAVRDGFLAFLRKARDEDRRVAAYGAAAKGNTLFNYCSVGTDLVPFVVDRSAEKQGRCLPGSRLPIHPPQRIIDERVDYVLILPWNLREEIAEQMKDVRAWGGKFVTAIPKLEVF
jgi:SAM-dependent methyltransferase